MKISILSILLLGLGLPIANAQEKIQTKITTEVIPLATVFKFKAEIKSSTNSFSNKAVTNIFRLRLDPSWTMADLSYGFRQDIKNRFYNGQDEYSLDNTRLFAGKIYNAGEFQINPRLEAWLPTNIKEREKLSYQGSPGFAVKIKRRAGMWTGNLETNVRKQYYQNSQDAYAAWIVYNELKNEFKFTKRTYANLNFKLDDIWDGSGKHSQKYLFEQGLAYKVADNFDFEVGHLIEKPLTGSFVGYDKDFSQIYTQVSYVY